MYSLDNYAKALLPPLFLILLLLYQEQHRAVAFRVEAHNVQVGR